MRRHILGISPLESLYKGINPDFPWGELAPADHFESNGFGLYNMVGNVAEHVWDNYFGGRHPSEPRTNPTGPGNFMDEPGRKQTLLKGGASGDRATICLISARVGRQESANYERDRQVDRQLPIYHQAGFRLAWVGE